MKYWKRYSYSSLASAMNCFCNFICGWGAWEQPPRGAPWVSGLVAHFVQTWPDSECSHTVQFLGCSELNWRLQSLSPILALYDPFGVDVPLNCDTISQFICGYLTLHVVQKNEFHQNNWKIFDKKLCGERILKSILQLFFSQMRIIRMVFNLFLI